MVVGLILLVSLKRTGMIMFSPFEWRLARKALPVSMCFIVNCILGMVALRSTNIPMFSTLRRLTVAMVMICEFFVLHKRPASLTVLSVCVMVLGSFIGGWADLQIDLFGYFMVLLNNLVTALNLVFLKKTLSDTELAKDTFGVLYYNSLLSIPFLILLALLKGEFSQVLDFPYLFDPGFQMGFMLSAVVSFLMNYSTYWCTEVNSALTTSVTGQVKNVLSSLVSLLIVSGSTPGVGVKATPLLVCGLTIGLGGSFMYAYSISSNKSSSSSSSSSVSNSLLNTREKDLEMNALLPTTTTTTTTMTSGGRPKGVSSPTPTQANLINNGSSSPDTNPRELHIDYAHPRHVHHSHTGSGGGSGSGGGVGATSANSMLSTNSSTIVGTIWSSTVGANSSRTN